MNTILIKITAIVVSLIGLITVITGTRALSGSFNPGYTTFPLLIGYNVFMGLVSIAAGYLIWTKHKLALLVSAIITTGHITVLLSLITVFSGLIAQQSVKAMIFRSVIWLVIFIIVRETKKVHL